MAYERKTFDIEISDSLRNVLEQIKSQSLVASLLLKKRHSKDDLVDDPVNFISISSQDKSRISYLTTERIGKIENDEFWSSSRRFHTKPGGFVSKIFKNIPSNEVEIFSNLFRLEANRPQFNMKVVSGEDIRNYYHHSKHASDNGSLGVSCMRYDKCQKYFGLYVENSDVISMLVMLNDHDEVMGRALLWTLEDKKVMDRIYTINDEQLPLYFKKWALENGFMHRVQQNWYNSLNFQSETSKETLKLKVKLTDFDFSYFPYMDTFRFLNTDNGELTNYLPSHRNFVTLCSSEGDTYNRNYLGYDEIDKVFRQRGELVHISYLDVLTTSNNCVYSNVNDEYILREHSRYDDEIEDYLFDGEYDDRNNSEAIERCRKRILGNQVEVVNSSNHRSLYEQLLSEIRGTIDSRLARSEEVVD